MRYAEADVMQEIGSGIWQVSGSRPGPRLIITGWFRCLLRDSAELLIRWGARLQEDQAGKGKKEI